MTKEARRSNKILSIVMAVVSLLYVYPSLWF